MSIELLVLNFLRVLMQRLVHLLGRMYDPTTGRVTIPGFYDAVQAPDYAEVCRKCRECKVFAVQFQYVPLQREMGNISSLRDFLRHAKPFYFALRVPQLQRIKVAAESVETGWIKDAFATGVDSPQELLRKRYSQTAR